MKNLLFSLIILLPLSLFAQNLLNNPESVAYDAENDRYLVSNCGDGKIIEIDSEGNQSEFYSGLGVCLGNCLYNGILYVSCQNYDAVTSGKAVVGIDIVTQELVMTVEFESNNTVDGLAADHQGRIYVLDTTGRLFLINIAEQSKELVLTGGMGLSPQDCIFDQFNNRLIVANFNGNSSYVSAVDPDDYSTTILLNPDFGSFDGVTMDQYGNVYLASYENGGCIYRVDDSFVYEPELISSGYTGPAGIDYNLEDDIIAVPSFYANIVNLVQVEFNAIADFSCSETSGYAPLEVQFYDETLGGPMVWWWDFDGDGSTDSNEQNPIWIFDEPGVYTIELKIHTGEFEDTEVKVEYIIVEETAAPMTSIQPIVHLEQNFPNPFNPTTNISFTLTAEDACHASLEIYNIKGQLVRSFKDHPELAEGKHSITWDGKDDQTNSVSSGVYFYKLEAGSKSKTKKMMLLQ